MKIDINKLEHESQNLICSECKNSFRWVQNTTINPKRCPRCQNALEFQKKSESKQKMQLNKKVLKNASFYGKKTDKRKETPNKVHIEKKLDTAWSLLVKQKAGFRCEYCGTTRALNSHHIYSRGNHSVRWSLENGICLCVTHHIGLEFSPHKTGMKFATWITRKRGQQFMDNLEMKAGKTGKMHVFEKELILKEMLDEIKKYEK